MLKGEKQYLALCERVLTQGQWVLNKRTGKKCLTVINADFEYNVGNKDFPILTTKKVFWRSAIAEMIGYLRGYTSAQEFANIGCRTWFANANKTQAWLDNPLRIGEDDMGKVYGAVAKDFGEIDLIKKVYNNLSQGIDDRGEIITFWKPDDFNKGCLRPCMFQHHFTLVNGTLNLHSYQRSVDLALGAPFNMVQCYFLLELMSKITGNKAGVCYHKLVNIHLYEDQVKTMKLQLERVPLESVNNTFQVDECMLYYYENLGTLKYPFSE